MMKTKLALLTTVAYFASTGNAYADNYNFYFSKPGKKKSKMEEPVISSDEDSQETSNDESSLREEEEVKKTETPAIANPNTQTVTIPNNQQPIVINNTNNVGYPNWAPPFPTTSPEPFYPEPPLKEQPKETGFHGETKVSTVLLPSYQETPRSNWRMGLSATLLLADAPHGYAYRGNLVTYESKTESWGGLVTLGWDLTRVLGFNFYGGMNHNSDYSRFKPHYGADLQLMPLRIPLKNFDLVELGFLVGGSNILAAENNVGSLHTGAKLNINFGKDYGFTASTRANLGHFLFEAGFVARI